MRLRTTLVLAAAVAAVLWIAWGLQDPPPAAPPRRPLAPEEIVAALDEIELHLVSRESLRIVERSGDYTLLHGRDARTGERWHLKDRADKELIEQLLRSIATSYREPIQGDLGDDDLLRFNLKEPPARMILRAAGREIDIAFGADDPSRDGMILAHEAGAKTAFRTGRQVRNLLEMNLEEWRDKEIFTLDPRVVDTVGVQRRTPERTLESFEIRQEGRRWRFTQPRPLKADGNKVLGFVRQLTSQRIARYTSPRLDDEEMQKKTGLPADPRCTLVLSAGSVVQVLQIGEEILAGMVAACLPTRDELRCFLLEREQVDRILEFDVGGLRDRRLLPPIEKNAVSLQSRTPDGAIRYTAERASRHPRGEWRMLTPFEGKLNSGAGKGSFAQVIVDLERCEAEEFVDPARPFSPDHELKVEWYDEPVTLRRMIAIDARDDGTVWVRAEDQGDEILRVPPRILEIAQLEPELYRDPVLLAPRDDERLSRWRFLAPGGKEILLEKEPGPHPPRPVVDPEDEASLLTSAASFLFHESALELVLARDVDPGWDAPRLTLVLTIDGVDHTLTVGRDGERGVLCRFVPRFGRGVAVVLERGLLRDLLRLAGG